MTKLCAILICLFAALAGIAQNHCVAQSANLDAARPRFGNPSVTSAAPPAESGAQFSQPSATSQWPVAGQVAPAMAVDRDTPLGVGDIVTFSIQEDRDTPVKLRVTDSGELDIPYVGRVPALNRTCDTVALEAKKLLESKYYYKATVTLGIDQRAIGRSLGKVYVSGLVKQPGPQDLFPGERLTVSAVIVKAGGFAQFADKARVRLTRRGSKTTENKKIDIGAVLEKGRADLDVEVQDGDYIYVPQKLINL